MLENFVADSDIHQEPPVFVRINIEERFLYANQPTNHPASQPTNQPTNHQATKETNVQTIKMARRNARIV